MTLYVSFHFHCKIYFLLGEKDYHIHVNQVVTELACMKHDRLNPIYTNYIHSSITTYNLTYFSFET